MLTYAGSRGDRKAAAPADDAGACGISVRVVQGTQFTCITGTKVQILLQHLQTMQELVESVCVSFKVLSLLALLVQKYKY